jgi:hypothetical protein
VAQRKLEKYQTTGRAGGLARKKGKSKRKMVKCSGCGKEIDAANITGMCLTCLNKSRAAKKTTGWGTCHMCGGPARRDNKTGYCYKCYRESLKTERAYDFNGTTLVIRG